MPTWSSLLDPTLGTAVVVAEQKTESATYYLIRQSDDDVGGEILIEESAQSIQVLKADTSVFPLTEAKIPPAVAAGLAPQALAGPLQTEEFFERPLLAAALSQQDLDTRVFDGAKAADGTLHTDVPGTDHGNLACAWAVNEVVDQALGKPIGGGLSTADMYDVLRRKHLPRTEQQAKAGAIIISPTIGNRHGHVGIVGECGASGPLPSTLIYSNRSSEALFGHAFTIQRWNEYFTAKNLPVAYFELDSRVFERAAPIGISVLAAVVPPGVNKIADMYAGDSRNPDFTQIHQAGIAAMIHKATDPIYTFDAERYRSRRSKARAEGLLWGSYHFGRTGDGAAQAEAYLAAIDPADDEFVCLDFEKSEKRPDTVMLLDQAADFIERVRLRLGKLPFLYGGNYLRESLSSAHSSPLAECQLWFADYRQRPSPEIPHLWNKWALWQYAGDIPAGKPGSLPTLEKTDRSVFNGEEAQLKAIWRCRP